MFRAILETQWKWTRGIALMATLIGFGLPIASLQNAQAATESANEFVQVMQRWGVAYALLAAGLGLFVAFAAEAANVKAGATVVVVGDGAVGLLGVLAAKQMRAGRIVAMSRHESRQKLAREFGATDIVTARGDEGVERVKELTKGLGADSVLECVGTQEAMLQAIKATRPGGSIGYVGVPHGVTLDGAELFFKHVHLHGGPAPVRRYLPKLIELVFDGTINPGKVFDLTLPLEQVAEGYRAMDERRAIKTLLRP